MRIIIDFRLHPSSVETSVELNHSLGMDSVVILHTYM